jgi:hypothetical protein
MPNSETDNANGRPATAQDSTPDKVVAQSGGNLNTVDIFGTDKGTPRPAPIHVEAAKNQNQKPIGTAELQSDETLVLHLSAESLDGKTHGDGILVIHPNDKDYSSIRQHIGEIHQGQLKFVSPWEDADTGGKPRAGGPTKAEIAPPLGTTDGDTAKAKSGVEDKGGPQATDSINQGGGANQPDATKQPDTGKQPESTKQPDSSKQPDTSKQPDAAKDADTAKQPGGAAAGQTVGDAAAAAKTAPPDPVVPASQGFDNQVSTTYNAMSPETRAIIAKRGATVMPVHHLTDALPELKNQAPRGWPVGSTWDSVDGCWSTSRNEIVVAEERRSLGNGQWVPSGRTDKVLRHEAGHAVDYTINMMSDLPDFKKAYDADLQAMPTGDKNALSYFLQSGPGGREETAAEGVADREGGATGGQAFHNDFPQTLKVINDTINGSAHLPVRGPGQVVPSPGGTTPP